MPARSSFSDGSTLIPGRQVDRLTITPISARREDSLPARRIGSGPRQISRDHYLPDSFTTEFLYPESCGSLLPRQRRSRGPPIGACTESVVDVVHQDAGAVVHRPRATHLNFVATLRQIITDRIRNPPFDPEIAGIHGVGERRRRKTACAPA